MSCGLVVRWWLSPWSPGTRGPEWCRAGLELVSGLLLVRVRGPQLGRSSRAPASTRRDSLPPALPLPHAAALSLVCPDRRAVAGQRCPEARHSRVLVCDVCRVGTRHDRCAGRPPCTCLLRRQRDQEGRGAAREDDHRPAVRRGGLDLEAARRACAPIAASDPAAVQCTECGRRCRQSRYGAR